MIAELSGIEPLVVNNDEADWAHISRLDFGNIVISPGPGRPDRGDDFGISRDAILDGRWPLLGVCLGHQGICHVFGGDVRHAPEPMHGRTSLVRHDGSELFRGIPSPFSVVRYHSLLADRLPEPLLASAWSEDGLLMALRHSERPMWGVQFHPESICTEHGEALLSNFLSLSGVSTKSVGRSGVRDAEKTVRVFAKKIERWLAPDRVFNALFGTANPSFWLDSSLVTEGMSRFSFMGDSCGPLSETVCYDVSTSKLVIRRGDQSIEEACSVLTYLDKRLRDLRIAPVSDLPFEFTPGFVGYFGYELKAETSGARVHKSESPDVQQIFADRVICFDHQERNIWLVCCDYETEAERAAQWVESVECRLAELGEGFEVHTNQEREGAVGSFVLRSEDEEYRFLIERCKEAIRDGESYEICLTNQITAPASQLDDLTTYLALRSINPAPFSAFLRFGDTSVLCSSPERFIRCSSDGMVQSKPIKGTIRRGVSAAEDLQLRESLRGSEKERAENLMIVDLIRNDLGRVCEIGSVNVPSLFSIESYATVHQLVSTVQGKLKQGANTIDVLRAMFPGGSMTGAPKIRTMEIIDALENAPRGIYSGAIGYLSINGAADLNIVIRTIVLRENSLSIGIGGAITALSDPLEELDETRLKAKALLNALTRSVPALRAAG
ncbi:aminodeoxychorismate synthase component I [Bradyrhizobium sp. BR 10261]|nr:aminodeoxychorismate synthase component I [Bradyrhizobium sp. BR 10261]